MDPALVFPLISAGASLVAVTAAVTTWLQKRRDTERALRGTLTDLLAKLTSLSLELAKADPADRERLSGAVGDQRRILVRHAVRVADEIPHLVVDIGYIVIAIALYDSGYLF